MGQLKMIEGRKHVIPMNKKIMSLWSSRYMSSKTNIAYGAVIENSIFSNIVLPCACRKSENLDKLYLQIVIWVQFCSVWNVYFVDYETYLLFEGKQTHRFITTLLSKTASTKLEK